MDEFGVRRAAKRVLNRHYTSLLSKRFGMGEYTEGMEMEFVLPRTIFENGDDPHAYGDNAADFSRGRSVREMLDDRNMGLEELRKIMEYGWTIGSSGGERTTARYGKLVYILSCATAITRHGDQLDHTIEPKEMADNLRMAIGDCLVPEEFLPLLQEAKLRIDDKVRKG